MAPLDAIARISKVLVLSYVVDWVFVMYVSTQPLTVICADAQSSIVALIGYGFSQLEPNHHAFYLEDPTISFPYQKVETVSTEVLVLVSLFAPAVIIVIGALLLTPGTAAPEGPKPSTSQMIRRKIWECNAGWLGLVVALAGVWMSTQGLKDLAGKPRPDLLSRCNPDVTKIAQYALGGLGERLPGAPILVSWKICRNHSEVVHVDGFSSFPSGHASCMC